ncbi:MAG: PilN domain-containing protein [bacterium]
MAGKPVIALALRARTLEWAAPRASADKTEAVLKQVALELDPACPSLLSGLRTDRARLVEEIRSKTTLPALPVALGIPSSWVLLRIADLPTSDPEELRGMAELQIDKYSPFPVDESVISHEILQQGEGHCRVLLSAVPTETINVVGDSLRAAGIRPKWVDINLLGWWKLLLDAGKIPAAGTYACAILDEDACDLLVTVKGVPAAMRALIGLEELPPAEQADEIAREIVHTLASLDIGHTSEPLSEVAVWHRGAPPAELLQRLADPFSVTAHAHPLESLPPLAEGLLRRAQARGHDMLDLAPPAWQQAEKSSLARRRAIVLSSVVLGIWATAMAILFGGLQIEKQQLARQEARLAALTAPAEKVRAVQERALALEQYVDRTRSALDCLREISDLLPPGIDLKSFSYHKGKAVELSGEANAVTLVYDFKKEMEKSKLFVSTDLSRIVHLANGKENFKLTAILPGGEKP